MQRQLPCDCITHYYIYIYINRLILLMLLKLAEVELFCQSFGV